MSYLREALQAMLRLFDDQGNMVADFNTLQTAVNDGYAALSAQPQPEAVEPVQWQFQALDGKWGNCEKPNEEDFKAYPERLRGLYTAPPLAPDERMRRAYSALQTFAAECHRSKWHFDLNEENPPNVYDARRLVRKAFDELQRIGNIAMHERDELKALSRADDSSNASAEARLLTGSLAKDVAASAKRISEWSAAKQDYARRAIGAGGDETTKSEGGPLNWELSDECKKHLAEIDRAIVRPGDPRLNQIVGGPQHYPVQEAESVSGAHVADRTGGANPPTGATPAEQREAVARPSIEWWLNEIETCNERMWNGSRVTYYGQIKIGIEAIRYALLTRE